MALNLAFLRWLVREYAASSGVSFDWLWARVEGKEPMPRLSAQDIATASGGQVSPSTWTLAPDAPRFSEPLSVSARHRQASGANVSGMYDAPAVGFEPEEPQEVRDARSHRSRSEHYRQLGRSLRMRPSALYDFADSLGAKGIEQIAKYLGRSPSMVRFLFAGYAGKARVPIHPTWNDVNLLTKMSASWVRPGEAAPRPITMADWPRTPKNPR